MKEEDSSREGRMRGEAVPAKKINWADVIRSIPTIRLCAAFYTRCTNESIRSIIVDNRRTVRYMLLSVLFRNGRLLLFDGSTDVRASHDFVSYTAGIRERLQVYRHCVCIISFLSRFFSRPIMDYNNGACSPVSCEIPFPKSSPVCLKIPLTFVME